MWVAGDWGLITWTVIALVIEYFVDIVVVTEAYNIAYRDGSENHITLRDHSGRSLFVTLATLILLVALCIRECVRKHKASSRMDDEIKLRLKWAQKFAEKGLRRQDSWRLRFLLWLREPSKTSIRRDGDGVEMETFCPQNDAPDLSLGFFFAPNHAPGSALGFPSTQPLSDVLRVIQVCLVIVETVVTALFEQKQPPHTQPGDPMSPSDDSLFSAWLMARFILFNCVVTPPATLYVWVDLNNYYGMVTGFVP